MANEILRKWSLDDQCQKSVVFVVATEDRRFWVARDPRVPVYAQEFTQIFADQVGHFHDIIFRVALCYNIHPLLCTILCMPKTQLP